MLGGRKKASSGLQRLKGLGPSLPSSLRLWTTPLPWEWAVNENYFVTDHKLIICWRFLWFLSTILFQSHISSCCLLWERLSH